MEAAPGGESAAGAGGYSAPASPGDAPGGSHAAQNDAGLSDNVAGALAYVTFIPAIIFLVIDPFKNRRFVRFHSFQCLFFNAFAFVVMFALGTLTSIIGLFGFGLFPLLQLAFFVVWLLVVIKAYQGQEFRLPIIGDLAAKQV